MVFGKAAALFAVCDARQTQGVANHKFDGQGPQPAQQGLPLSELLAAAAEPSQYQNLVRFARWRLKSLNAVPENKRPLARLDAEDLVAQALFQVSLGGLDPRLGRQLSASNRASIGAFLICLKGIIRSNSSNLLKSVEAGQMHLLLGDELEMPGAVDPADPTDLNAQLIRRDLQQVVFERLYRAVASMPALLPAIRDWEQNFLTAGRIGDRGQDRNLDHRLSRLVRRILEDLAREIDPGDPDGREMLL
jgi:hypothetical protein